ncbi:hypothetical protein [Pseudobacteroides cellulosolvens]|uniref:Uncharacterized protein n=1 Tax=Pseudobacteroides cellulosolvens ATCC 35603 = DSM 2933 TaxID=398512 RepID=A0A0L6JKS4_9FIRM|nr:hypothetical protein [Pseudobacteroides cellulosolvens]KNY26313.1 hypothetical protein Bccel_1575 [Pseudobacteroides cellulosolvens ATCC 35603 = DSM 2933]
MEQLNEKVLDAVNSVLQKTEKIFNTYEMFVNILKCIIFTLLICVTIMVGFFTISNSIKESNIAKYYFNQNYSQSIQNNDMKMNQSIKGGQ